MLEVLDQARLLVVTGKGGTGKTTVAAGLAVAAAGRGRRVLVAEVEGRQGLAGLFGRRVLEHREARVAEGSTRWPSTRTSRCGSTWPGTGSRRWPGC